MNEQDFICLNYRKTKILIKNIQYIKGALGNYSWIRLNDDTTFFSSFTLKYYIDKLEENKDFVVIRKGLLINIQYIMSIIKAQNAYWVVLNTGEKFQFSRRKVKTLKSSEKLNKYVLVETDIRKDRVV